MSTKRLSAREHITIRVVTQLYKDLVIEYPLKIRTQVFGFAVHYFLQKVSKNKKDKWLKENNFSQNNDYTSARVVTQLYKDLVIEYPLTTKTHLINSAIKYFSEEVSKNKKDKWLKENGVIDKY